MTDLTDRSRWEEAAEALSRYLAGARPAATLVGVVASLVHPEMLVEIEVDDGADPFDESALMGYVISANNDVRR